MEYLDIKEITDALNGKLIVKGTVDRFNNVSIDSRKVNKGDIFFAIKGENFDGHEYVVNSSSKGAALCIVHNENFNKEELCEFTSVILVEDTRVALLDLAKYYRNKLDIKVIGITGSTGKTSTKDLVAAVLSEKYKVFKTKGNFNNEIGLPLMIFNLDNSYDIAVLELGMSNLGEIHRLSRVSNPDIGIITNVGLSHIENLKTRENILKAKMEITDFFNDKSILIINGDNDLLKEVSSEKYKIIKIGIENDYNFTASGIIIGDSNIKFNIRENNLLIDENFVVPVLGKHNVLNSLLAIAVAKNFNMDYKDINKGFNNLEATSMRLDILKCDKFTIINDAYNASPDSMEAALDVLKDFKGSRKIAVLGTMKELGDESYNAHKEVAQYAKLKGIDLLIAIGDFKKAFKDGFQDENCILFENKEEAVKYLCHEIKTDDVILIKASRSMEFETIISELKKLNVKEGI
ncbi:MAG: UDP-N-acetylmuramoyl-tripeptide--D-alanyl-D-alanine ligase [Clostridium argentinense]|nr:UDP-N-acetylmuramoyl-tripeptide--D-alanyl-D-alanine ligase [Clostridium argentinense]